MENRIQVPLINAVAESTLDGAVLRGIRRLLAQYVNPCSKPMYFQSFRSRGCRLRHH